MGFPTTYWPYVKFAYLFFCMCWLIFMSYDHEDCFQKNSDWALSMVQVQGQSSGKEKWEAWYLMDFSLLTELTCRLAEFIKCCKWSRSNYRKESGQHTLGTVPGRSSRGLLIWWTGGQRKNLGVVFPKFSLVGYVEKIWSRKDGEIILDVKPSLGPRLEWGPPGTPYFITRGV